MSGAVRTLVVWCPDWPVVAAGVPLDEPAAVLHANRVVACSPGARHRGVTVGVRRREAQGRCPELHLLERDPATEARRFEAVLAAVEAFTPRLELTHPGACAVATRGPSRYFGGDRALAARVAGAVAEVLAGHGEVRVGVADGPFAARLAARSHRSASHPLVVPPGGTPAFLAPLPLVALERPELTDVLARLGLRTLGDLAALPLRSVTGRFGADGEAAHRLASGLDERPPHLTVPPPDLEAAATLDPPAERVDQVAFVAKGLADDLHGRLAARGLACTRVLIAAETEHGERHERRWRHEGALSAAALAERARWQFDGWLHGPVRSRPTAGVSRLALVPDEVVVATGRQLGFWGGETDAAERARRALARVEGLLGPDAVLVPEWRGGREPGERVALVPVGAVDLVAREEERAARAGGGHPAPPSWTGAPPWPGQLPDPAPARVHDPLRPARVVDDRGRPVVVDGRAMLSAPPSRVAVGEGPAVEVVAWAGPWPLDERWWDAPRRRRRARFQVVVGGGVAHLLVLDGGRWWCAATYD